MSINYTTKQKYLDNAPAGDIDGHTPTSVVHDTHYMPQNAERVEEEETDVPLLMKCLAASIVCAVVLAAAVYWVFG